MADPRINNTANPVAWMQARRAGIRVRPRPRIPLRCIQATTMADPRINNTANPVAWMQARRAGIRVQPRPRIPLRCIQATRGQQIGP
jgi:hypothetical protein